MTLDLDPSALELAVAPTVVLIVEMVKRLAAGAPKWVLPAAALLLAVAGQGFAAGLGGDGIDPALGVLLWLCAIGLYEAGDQGQKMVRGRSRPIRPRGSTGG